MYAIDDELQNATDVHALNVQKERRATRKRTRLEVRGVRMGGTSGSVIKKHTLSQLSAAPQTNVGHIFHRDRGSHPEDVPHFQLSG